MMTPIDFRGFRFGNVHSSDLHLEVVSTSNRYEARTLPAPTDTAQDVPGSDGQYYFGSVYKNREITVNVAFDNVTEQIYRKIRQLFATDKPQDLVFDEEPYKTWKAKLKAKPDFKSLCFTDDDGNRVYKGDGKLQFICYFPYAFGFDKYIVKAADYYMLTPPEQILCELSNDEDDFYFASRNLPAPAWIPADLRYHYNVHPSDETYIKIDGNTEGQFVERDDAHKNKGNRSWDPNDSIAWKIGYPTIEQVQGGELYFDLNGKEKTLVTTREYWDNIPEWQSTARLLTTPTLDFDQGLMYLPQYSKSNYINMELGFDNSRPLIGSRLLVYNPGDLPIDWQLKLDVNKRSFWSGRGSERFRVRRFNVERLEIPQAVDWCKMRTINERDNERFKYGNKYFRRKKFDVDSIINKIITAHNSGYPLEISDGNGGYLDLDQIITMIKLGSLPADKNWGMRIQVNFVYRYIPDEHEILQEPEYRETSYCCMMAELPSFIKQKIENTFAYLRSKGSHVLNTVVDWSEWNDTMISPTDFDPYSNIVGLEREGNKLSYNLNRPYIPEQDEPWATEHLYNHDTGYYVKVEQTELVSFSCVTIPDSGSIFYDYEYENYTSNPITIKDDEKIRKQSESGPVENYRPLSPRVAYNLHLNNPRIGGVIFGDESPFLYEELGDAHPKFCYYAEPIPRQRLGEYIRLFYWQSKQLSEGELIYNDPTLTEFKDWVSKNYYMSEDIDFEKGAQLADRYEEVLKQCITEEEEFELYWDTLEKLFQDFIPLDESVNKEDLFYDFVNCPLEYIPCDSRDLDYGQEVFNAFKYPRWMTPDYLEIDSTKLGAIPLIIKYMEAIGLDEKSLFNGDKIYYDRSLLTAANLQDLRMKLDKLLGDGGCINDLVDKCYYLNSDVRMLYALEEPRGQEFNYKPNKIVMNEAITKGKWFKIPPGWSLITIEPVMDSNLYGGKRWVDARPFDWGYGGDVNNNEKEVEQLFKLVYDYADLQFRQDSYDEMQIAIPPSERDGYWETPFNKWYESKIDGNTNLFMIEYYYHKRYYAEQRFLSIIDDYWNMVAPYYSWTSRKGVYQQADKSFAAQDGKLYLDQKFDVNDIPIHSITNHISDWWWYACNFLWGNFPPIYWTAADMLNNMKIEYTPLFY